MGTIPSTTTAERQAPTALLALVQHIHAHSLSMPMSINRPTHAGAPFLLTVPADSLDGWTASGLQVTNERTEPRFDLAGRLSWERVQLDGLLDPHGIRVQLVAARTIAPAALTVVPA